jgi:hypothetical protein
LSFLIVVEGSSIEIIKAKIMGTLKAIKLGNGVFLSYLLFVYDIFLFIDGTWRDALKLKEILDLYYSPIKMMANINK